MQLQTSTGYTGGTKWSRKWKALKKALDAYQAKGTLQSIKMVQSAAAAADTTFDAAKKRTKVGEPVAVNVQRGLRALLTDCEIEILRRQYDTVSQSGDVGASTRAEQRDRLQRIRVLMLQTTDTSHALAQFLAGEEPAVEAETPVREKVEEARHDAGESSEGVRPSRARMQVEYRAREREAKEHYKSTLVELLKSNHYTKIQDEYWEAPSQDDEHVTPHVAWKAHLGCTPGDALELAERTVAILLELGVDHKIDTNPEVFFTTNKFVTIYPPGPKAAPWSKIIAALEDAVGHLAVPAPGELPVGAWGVVGMRHGQNTPLTVEALEALGVKVVLGPPAPEPYQELPQVILEAGDGPAPKVDDRANPGSVLVARGQGKTLMLWFAGGKDRPCPAILHDGAIKPDPRKDPNPHNEPLPADVVQWVKRDEVVLEALGAGVK